MDNAHSHPVATVDCHGSTPDQPPTSSEFAPTTSLLSNNPSPSRQQRLLQGRNARFPAKKLSITGLSNRLNQLIHANTETESKTGKNQENRLSKRRSIGVIGKELSAPQSSGILKEISNSSRHRSVHKRSDIPIYQDNLERPLLDQSPFASPTVYQDTSSGIQSPSGLDHIQDSFSDMRLQEISVNTRTSPLASSLKGQRRKQQSQLLQKFDADEYIEHIEKELQQARNDAYSPKSHRPLKEKLRSAIYENERLQKELSQVRDRFDAEIKRTVEHKTATEIELHRKVRDLQDVIDDKNGIIRELQCQREEKRLDNTIIETLKSTIERLEQEKNIMEDENMNVTKRNDILTQLLAMSPSKPHSTQIASPSREKRPGRPLSLVLPRPPSSPSTKFATCTGSTITSPILEPFSRISPPKSVDATENEYGSTLLTGGKETMAELDQSSQSNNSESTQFSSKHHFRQGIFYSGASSELACDNAAINSPTGEGKTIPKKRPRRFLRGSTQLKPLLLPSLNSDVGILSSPPSTSLGYFESKTSTSFEPETSSSVIRHSVLRAETGDLPQLETTESVYESACIGNLGGPGPMLLEQEEKHLRRHKSTPQQSAVPGDTNLVLHNWKISDEFDTETSDYSPSYRCPGQQLQLYRESSPLHYFDFVKSSSSEPDLPSHMDGYTHEWETEMPPPLFSPKQSLEKNPLSLDHRFLRYPIGNTFQRYRSRKRKEPCSPLDESYNSPTPKWRCRGPPDLISHTIPAPKASSSKNDAVKDASNGSQSQRVFHRLRMIKSPVDFINGHIFDARSIASLSIRTLYGFLSLCTSYVRKVKRDPYSLARIVLANAWHQNWAAMGKMSWWVLGLFIDPGHSHVRRRDIDWAMYDAEDIAHKACFVGEAERDPDYSRSPAEPIAKCNDRNQSDEQISYMQPKPDQELKSSLKTRWGKSILLWGKFSMALVLAVGGAVIQGPAEMLKDVEKLKRRSLEMQKDPKRSGVMLKNSENCEQYSESSMLSMKKGNPRPTSVGLSLAQVRSPIFTFRSGSQFIYPLSRNVGQHDDIDKTLRPEHCGRSRIETVFSLQNEDHSFEPNPFANTQLLNPKHSVQESSYDHGFLQWPSTPDSLIR